MIKIPNDTKIVRQTNTSDVLGDLWASQGLDLTSNIGSIRLAPRLELAAENGGFTFPSVVSSFVHYVTDNVLGVFGACDDKIIRTTGGSRAGSFGSDGSTGTPVSKNIGSLEIFNGAMYAFGDGIYKMDSGGSVWSTLSATDAKYCKSTCIYGGRLYFTRSFLTLSNKIGSIDISDVVSVNSGTPNVTLNTLDLSDFGTGLRGSNTITCIRSSSNKIWISTIDSFGLGNGLTAGTKGNIFEWDGVSTQTTKQYQFDSYGVLSMIIKDDIPYCVTVDGKLWRFNGGGFDAIAQFPIPWQYYTSYSSNANFGFIHSNGMCIQNNRIQMLVNNSYSHSSASGLLDYEINERFPSGIWEYDDNNGLYHKASVSITPQGTNSTIKDYNQTLFVNSGALFNSKLGIYPNDYSNRLLSDMMSNIYCSAAPFSTAATQRPAVFLNVSETKNATVERCGYFVTQKIESQGVRDTWQKLILKYNLLANSTDRIYGKYRTREIAPTSAIGTWTATNTVTTTTNLSAYSIGDEIEFLTGFGAGVVATITSITLSAGTYTIVFDQSITSPSGTSLIRLQKWKKFVTVNNQTEEFTSGNIDATSNWIQIKVIMYWKGDNELNEIVVVNKTLKSNN